MQHIERPTPRHGFLWPMILIGLGVLILLGNLGTLSWNVWDAVFRLWPIVLVGAGLEILIGRRSSMASLAVAVVTIVVIIAGAGLLSTQPFVSSGFTTETISQPIGGAKSANVVIGMGVGELRIGAAQAGNDLVQGKVDLRPGERLTRDFTVAGNTANFTLRTQDQRTSIWPGPRREEQRVWELHLTREVPIALTIDAGVSGSTIDLRDVRISSLHVNSGVGRMDLVLPHAGTYTLNVNGGVGEMVITVPNGVAARITVASHLGGLNVPSSYTKNGGTYTSPNYETATNRADVSIASGVGSITIR